MLDPRRAQGKNREMKSVPHALEQARGRAGGRTMRVRPGSAGARSVRVKPGSAGGRTVRVGPGSAGGRNRRDRADSSEG